MKKSEQNIEIFSPFYRTFEECKQYTRQYAKSFYFSSFMLPMEKRYAAYAVYTFCRYADNVVDNSDNISIEKREFLLIELKCTLNKIYEDRFDKTFGQCVFYDTILKYKIPKQYFLELIGGVQMDNTKKRYATQKELDDYCYKVASVIGIIMCYIFGFTDEDALPYAVSLGRAMQLTNILRDIQEDFAMGRVYLPSDILAKFNYTEEDIRNNTNNENFKSLIKYYINISRNHYVGALKGIPYLTNDGSRATVYIMLKIYSGILSNIERNNYDIYSSRIYVSTRQKINIFMRSIFRRPKEILPEPILI